MSEVQLMARATASLVKVVRDIKPDQLSAQTPCTEYDVRRLVNHLLFWGPSLEGAARKQAVPPPAGDETDVDLTAADWAAALEAHIERTVAAWSRPVAWQGTTHVGGPTQLPAPLVGGMIVIEFVVHGWDLARAIGQRPAWDDEVTAYLYDELVKTAEQGRQLGIYGPEIPIPASSPMLDRVLGLTGRDPAWNS